MREINSDNLKQWIRSETNQQQKAQQFLTIACKTLGLQEDAKVSAVKDNTRFVLEFEQNPAYPDFPRNMIKLERLMQGLMGIPVDLRLKPKADINKRFDRNYLRGVEKLEVGNE